MFVELEVLMMRERERENGSLVKDMGLTSTKPTTKVMTRACLSPLMKSTPDNRSTYFSNKIKLHTRVMETIQWWSKVMMFSVSVATLKNVHPKPQKKSTLLAYNSYTIVPCR